MNESTLPPQIVYYAAKGDDIKAQIDVKVYCDANKTVKIVTAKKFNEIMEAISLLNSVGCNISLRHVRT